MISVKFRLAILFINPIKKQIMKNDEAFYVRCLAFIAHAIGRNIETLPIYEVKAPEVNVIGSLKELSIDNSGASPKLTKKAAIKNFIQKPWKKLQTKRSCGQSQRSSRENHAHIPPLKRK